MYFKVNSDNHYTIRAYIYTPAGTTIFLIGKILKPIMLHGVGFEPTQLMLPGLKSGSLDHSDNRAINILKTYLGL